MARRRMIDPNIWQSEDFSKLSVLARLLFIGMFSMADDEGKGRAKPVFLRSILFPYDEVMRLIDVEKALSEIGTNMSVTFYKNNENDYYIMNNWKTWQRVDKPQPSLIPDPKPFESQSGMIPESVENDSRLKERKIKEEKIEEENIEKKNIEKKDDYGVVGGFDEFWQAYPRKESKQSALNAFKKLKPNNELLAVMINALEIQKKSEQWQKDKGQFIPHPSTWLNQKRWEDELEPKTQEEIYAEFDIKPFVLGVDDQ